MKTVQDVRKDFPILDREINGYPLAYLDNAASTLKPKQFVDVISQHYLMGASNVHRGVHQLSEEATTQYESTRGKIKEFINAKEEAEIVYASGTTDAINKVARGLREFYFKKGDEIIVSEMEHHSNIVPWQMAAEKTGATIKVLPLHANGTVHLDEFEKLLSSKTKLVAINMISNSLGTINPVQSIISKAHEAGALVLIDGAQAIAHMPIDVQNLDCDFFTFSGHKIFSATGTGVLYGKREWLEKLPPDVGGGDMIERVSFDGTTYADLPARLEAGTPHIAGFIGLGASIDYVCSLGFDYIQKHENELLQYGTEKLSTIDKLEIVGTAEPKASIISFVIDGIHAHDLGSVLDMKGVAIRTGHHCTMPANDKLGYPATARASFSIYNTKEEIDRLADAIEHAKGMFL